MASANGSAGPAPAEDNEDPERTQRYPAIQAVVDRQFSDDETGDETDGGR